MNILITGGSGLVGSALCESLDGLGHTITVLSRSVSRTRKKLPQIERIIAHFDEVDSTTHFDAVINLAGESIADKRWTPKRKQVLRDSRIALTADLIALIKRLKTKPDVLISGSAIGYYGDGEDNILTEHSSVVDEFSHQLCAAWETQALRAKAYVPRVCIIRTGIVFSQSGGMLKKLLPSFRFGLGAKLGDGKQWMSWIHLRDLVSVINQLLNDASCSGIYNATSPNPITNAEFTKLLAHTLKRPSFLTLSSSFLHLLFGEMSQLLITGQRVKPKRLLDAGFEFEYPDAAKALNEIIKK